MSKHGVVQSMALLAVCGCFGAGAKTEQTQGRYLEVRGNGFEMASQTGFYCNTKALTATERARHEALTKKLLAKRRETIETEKGYEFQYEPEDLSVAEVAEWVVAEGKCCPFFDFHIDLEKQGRLVCLRLTGGEGIKGFIRSEFGLK
ncbi:MAG TPA: hypothetical protein VFP96_05670 [Candidatus Acidoferrum sp.]|nr:hypothetical protein [Candidatus Acidoferrum sp.]